jgi:hypothetical protein
MVRCILRLKTFADQRVRGFPSETRREAFRFDLRPPEVYCEQWGVVAGD